MHNSHRNIFKASVFLLPLFLAAIPGLAMNHNLAFPWGDTCSPPQTPFLSFSSPQSANLLFESGETLEFRCQAGLRSVALRWTLHRNMISKPFREGPAEALPGNRFVIRLDTAGLQPGFYDLRVELDTGMANQERDALARRPVRGICTFGWKPQQMAIAETRPADFTKFWDAAKAELANIPLDAREGPVQAFGPKEINDYNVASACLPPDYDPSGHRAERVNSCKVDFAGPDGGRVYGWLAKPEGKGPFPVMLVLPGAGFAARSRPLEHARHGYLALDVQVHGQDVDLATYPKLPGYHSDFQYDPPSAYYYYRVQQRCLQAITYLLSRPDADPTRVVVVGGSQGGRLGIILAGLDPRVKAVVSCFINSPNHPQLRWVARCNGYAELGAEKPDPSTKLVDGTDLTGAPPVIDDTMGRCFAYYDPMNYAPDIHCPVLMGAGLIDPVSPPFSVWAVFNRLGTASKTLVAFDGHAHDWSAEFDRRAWRWLDEVLSGKTISATPGSGAAVKAPAGLTVVCLGDSITGQSNLAKYLKFSHVLALMIRARTPGAQVAVLNRGIGGDTTDGVLKRLDADVLQAKPDLVVLLIGGNDAAAKAPGTREHFARNYDSILTRLRAAGIRVLALQYHVLPNPATPETAWVHMVAHNELIAQLAAKHGVPVLDMGAAMRKASQSYRVEELVNEKDGVHLNSAGELVFSETIFTELARLGWLP